MEAMTGGGPGRGWRRGRHFAFGAPRMGAFVAALEGGATIEAAARKPGWRFRRFIAGGARSAAFAAAWDAAVAKSAGPVLVWNRRGRAGRSAISPAGCASPGSASRPSSIISPPPATSPPRPRRPASGDHLGLPASAQLTPPSRDGFQEALETRPSPARGRGGGRDAGGAGDVPDRSRRPTPQEAAQASSRRCSCCANISGARPDRAAAGGPRPTKWSFEEAFEALEKRLKAFGMRIDKGDRDDDEAGTKERRPLPPGRPGRSARRRRRPLYPLLTSR